MRGTNCDRTSVVFHQGYGIAIPQMGAALARDHREDGVGANPPNPDCIRWTLEEVKGAWLDPMMWVIPRQSGGVSNEDGSNRVVGPEGNVGGGGTCRSGHQERAEKDEECEKDPKLRHESNGCVPIKGKI